MTRATRTWVFLGAAGVLAGFLACAFAGLPGYHAPLGSAARAVADHAVHLRKANNVVITTAFDIRGFDTLAEEVMLFVAAVGATVLLRSQRGEPANPPEPEIARLVDRDTSPVARTMIAVVPLVLVLGTALVTHGLLSPGGGFQGGVMLAAALVFVYVTGRMSSIARTRPFGAVEVAHAAGAAAFVLIAIGGLVDGSIFFFNFVPYGQRGALWSGGFIALANVAVGVEVGAAFTVVFAEFMDVVPGSGGR